MMSSHASICDHLSPARLDAMKRGVSQRGINGDGATFSGCYEGKLELDQHIGQEIGVGSCHFLEFSEVGGNLARDTQSRRQHANRETAVVGARWFGQWHEAVVLRQVGESHPSIPTLGEASPSCGSTRPKNMRW